MKSTGRARIVFLVPFYDYLLLSWQHSLQLQLFHRFKLPACLWLMILIHQSMRLPLIICTILQSNWESTASTVAEGDYFDITLADKVQFTATQTQAQLS